MALVDQSFDAIFTFSRGSTGPYRNAAGDTVTAGLDQPRFDHAESGRPLGLLIEGRTGSRSPDQLRVKGGEWAAGPGTVLHVYLDHAAETVRTAWYSNNDPAAALDACLNVQGHHQMIAFVRGFLANRGGFVRWRRQVFTLGGILIAQPGTALGSSDDNLFLEG